MAFKTKHLDLQ